MPKIKQRPIGGREQVVGLGNGGRLSEATPRNESKERRDPHN
jgi:hypothetical protein